MGSNTPPLWDLYHSSWQAIQDAAGPTEQKNKEEGKYVQGTESMVENDSTAVRQEGLEDILGRLVEKSRKQEPERATKGSHSLGAKRAVSGDKRTRPEVSDGAEAWPKATVCDEAGREDQCLGLVAEAFADELDLLRQDEHFRGSDRDVATMADMMRCMVGGMDSTEQKLFLESRAR